MCFILAVRDFGNRGWHLTRLPGTAHSSPAIGQHPWVQSLRFFLGHISIQTNRNVNEKPRLLPLILTFTCAIGQKRASVPRRAPRGPTACCTACLMAPITTNTQLPLPRWQPERSHSMSEWMWTGECANEHTPGNHVSGQQLSVPDLALKTQRPNWKLGWGEW